MQAAAEYAYSYARSSTVATVGGTQVSLATSDAPLGDASMFFDGFVEHAEQTAKALLVVAKVARSRYFVPQGMLAAVVRAADPVVTSNRDRMRFESFSACCGVYARLDLLPDGLAVRPLAVGTTNVDFNPPMRQALTQVIGNDPLHLQVGTDVTVTTLDATITEQSVPLPDRWLRSFAESQLAAARMRPMFTLAPAAARRFVRGLPAAPAGRSRQLYALANAVDARLTAQKVDGAVPIGGPERLKVLEPLLRFATNLHAYASPDAEGGSIWQLDLPGARFVLGLSQEPSRGFSGEGGMLLDLANATAARDADALADVLAFDAHIELETVAARANLSTERALAALNGLAATGRVGYDNAESAYFHRELPFGTGRLVASNPRLRNAQQLVESDSVKLDPLDPAIARVVSVDSEYVVRETAEGPTCTCPWFAAHRATRGPCKHMIAVDISRRTLAEKH